MTTLHELTNDVRALVIKFIQNQSLESDSVHGGRVSILINGVHAALKQLQAMSGDVDQALAMTLVTGKVQNQAVENLRAKINVVLGRLHAAITDPSLLSPALDAASIATDAEVATRIARHVAKAKSFTLEQIRELGRSDDVSWCRQIICWLVRRHTSLGIVKIGELLNRDHSTVLYSIRMVDMLVSGVNVKRTLTLKKFKIPNARTRGFVVEEVLQFDADAAEIRRQAQEGVRAPAETAERPNQESKPLHRQARGHSSTMVTTGGGHVKSGAAGNQSERR